MILLEPSQSFGAEAISQIINAQKELDNRMKEANSLCEGLSSAQQRLERLRKASTTTGWDGEDAPAASLVSYNNAKCFLQDVPIGIPAPDPGIDTNGHMTLEWRQPDGRLLSLTFDEHENVHYIVFLKSEKIYGLRPVSFRYNDKLSYFLDQVMKD